MALTNIKYPDPRDIYLRIRHDVADLSKVLSAALFKCSFWTQTTYLKEHALKPTMETKNEIALWESFLKDKQLQ